ncbi:MAG: hypothetical protein ABR512_11705 [Desulfopila sp.]
MTDIQQTILSAIYSCFTDWSAPQQFCCHAGCATCCSCKVTVTALEGRRIVDFCRFHNRLDWLIERLRSPNILDPPKQTTNEYISATLEQQDPLPQAVQTAANDGQCPFLEKDICTIYEVRPFSCRCFVSTTPCSPGRAATIPDHYLYGAMAAQQIIEHLGQFSPWGYLTDIIIVEICRGEGKRISATLKSMRQTARARIRRAQPLPGFIIPDDEQDKVAPLLHSIFRTTIDTRTIEEILNGTQR